MLSDGYGSMVPMSRESMGFSGAKSSELGTAGLLPDYADRVLEVAEAIPPGSVLTYGDIAAWLAEEAAEASESARRAGPPAPTGRPRPPGPRQVGRAMALYGSAVPWWRVVRSDGVLLPGRELSALEHYRQEGTPLRAASRGAPDRTPRLDMARARWPALTADESDPQPGR